MPIQLNKKDRPFTYSDYLKWTGDERWELIDGVAYSMGLMKKAAKVPRI